jgi:signal transduction histidine kinase
MRLFPNSPDVGEPRRLSPSVVAGLYCAGGALWVLGGEWWTHRFLAQDSAMTWVQSAKGLAFVAFTGLLLYLLLSWREARLEAAWARLDLVLRQVPGLLWTTDVELRLLSVTGAGLSGLPYVPEELVGRRVADVVEGAERRAVLEAAHRQALAGTATDCELELDGRFFVMRVEPLRSPPERIVGCVAFALDASGLHLAEPAGGIRGALRRSQLLASVGALVLEVAHQLMNPLFAMSAALDAFEQRSGDDPATSRHRAILRQQMVRIRVLVTGLQEYGRVGELQRRATDLGALLRRVAAEWSERARAAGVGVRVESPDDGELTAHLDPDAFGRALGRLVENGIQHSRAGGVVTLAAGRDEVDPGLLRVTVRDQGAGFLPQDYERSLEPLFSRRPEGAGLGLAVADRIVQLHGGRIEVGNDREGGGKVVVTLTP